MNAVRDIPSIGNDYSPAYGYAQEHDTLVLWLNLWIAHECDVIENGTPPPCRRLIDQPTSAWNKCMGNVDTIRNVLSRAMAVRGPNSGPGSLMWYLLLDYILYQGFRVYQYALLEKKMDHFITFKQLQKAKQAITFRSYLYHMSSSNSFGEMVLQEYFPGLKENINRWSTVQEVCIPSFEANGCNEAINDVSSIPKPVGYFAMKQFLDPNDPLFNVRMNSTLNHAQVSTGKPKEGKKNAPQGRCILCCEICSDKGQTSSSAKKCNSRMGRKTVKSCSVCKVHLCKFCFEDFHKSIVTNLPICSPCSNNNIRSSRNKNDGSRNIETPRVQRKRRMGCIAADISSRTRRSNEETIRDTLPNLPDSNAGTTSRSDNGALDDTLPGTGSKQNWEIENGINVDDDDGGGAIATHAV